MSLHWPPSWLLLKHEDHLRAILSARVEKADRADPRRLWLLQSAARIAAQLEPGAKVTNLTVVARCPDGFTVAYGIDPGDVMPEQVIVSEVTASVGGEEVAALMFTGRAPDDPRGLA